MSPVAGLASASMATRKPFASPLTPALQARVFESEAKRLARNSIGSAREALKRRVRSKMPRARGFPTLHAGLCASRVQLNFAARRMPAARDSNLNARPLMPEKVHRIGLQGMTQVFAGVTVTKKAT